jgi:nucleoredoxin
MTRFALLLMLAVLATAAEKPLTHPVLRELTAELVDAKGAPVSNKELLKNTYIFVYFSAHWCPPCKLFTPKLVEYVKKNSGGNVFGVLFASRDKSAEEMAGYMKEFRMSWPAVAYDSKNRELLKEKYGGRGIPCLVVLNEQDEVVFHTYKGEEFRGPQAVLDDFTALFKKK